ncbi:MAG: AbrB/MazE/SpoVT family DNA-binding domain-containing protein [Clostridia bacterium]|nr:AbrB/MazE/SpoVT family DNA-binding domain-containing protein [Clostridia bacterium]
MKKQKDDKYFMSSVKVGPKGQIVIPKEAREMFGVEIGDTLVLLADKGKGIAIQRMDMLHPYLKKVFDGEVE